MTTSSPLRFPTQSVKVPPRSMAILIPRSLLTEPILETEWRSDKCNQSSGSRWPGGGIILDIMVRERGRGNTKRQLYTGAQNDKN